MPDSHLTAAQLRSLLGTKVICLFETARRACLTADVLGDRAFQPNEVPVANRQLIPLDREASWLRTAFRFAPVMIRRDVHTTLRFNGTRACPVGILVGAVGLGPEQGEQTPTQPLTGRQIQTYFESPEVQARLRQDDRRCRTYQRLTSSGQDRIRVRYANGEQRDFDLVDRSRFRLIANQGR